MPLTIYGFHNYPNDFAVTKIGAAFEECAFLLDFSRPLKAHRQLFGRRLPFGITMGWLVPVIHVGEETAAGLVVGVQRGEPYFTDLPKLWREHRGKARQLTAKKGDNLTMLAQFGHHFPDDARVP